MAKSFDLCLQAGFRLLFHCVVFGLVAGLFLIDVHHGEIGGVLFSEQSWTEYAQLVLLLLTAIAFGVGGRLQRARHIPAYLLAAVALLAAVREMDWVVDRIAHGFWKVPTAGIVLVMVAYLWKQRSALFDAFAREVVQSYWGTLCSGFGMVFVFSRLFGMRRNWEAMLSSEMSITTIRSVRRLAEEGTELAGYALIFVAAAGFLFSCHEEWKLTHKR